MPRSTTHDVLPPDNADLFDLLPALLWEYDRAGTVVNANPAARTFFGAGSGAAAAFPPPGAAETHVLATGAATLRSIERVRGAERTIDARVDRVPRPGVNGSGQRVLVIATEIEPAAGATDGGEERSGIEAVAAALHAADGCVFMFDRDSYRFQYVNAGAAAQVGYETDELCTMTPLDIKPEFDRASFDQLVRPLIDEPERSARFTTVHRHRSGRDIPVHVTLRFVPTLGPRGQFVAIVVDVSELERVRRDLEQRNTDLAAIVIERTLELDAIRQRFERAIRGSQHGLWEWTVGEDDCWYSDQFWSMLGFDPARYNPRTLSAFNERLHADDVEPTWKAVRDTVESGRPLGHKYRLQMIDGSYRWFSVHAIVALDPHGRKVLSGSTLDIHVMITAEAELRRAKLDLEERVADRTAALREHVASLADRNDQLDQFARVAAHDLRAPLRTISGFAHLATEAGDATERAEHLQRVLGGSRRMNELLDGIATYSQVGRAELKPVEVDLDELLAGVTGDLQADIDGAGATVTSGRLGTVRADRPLLRQVFLNLLGNSLKFVAAQPPEIRVEREDEPDAVLLRVIDNGIGIEQDFAEQVFEPFHRLHGVEAYPGSGVGLSVCRRVVELHGGRIWVEPAPRGTIIALTLPTAEKEAPC